MTGNRFDGYLSLEVWGRNWKKNHRPPLFLTLLDRGSSFLALPTDQSGGLRGGDQQVQKVTVRDAGDLRWFPPASSLYYPGGTEGTVCILENHLQVEQGSRLAYCPKTAIPCGEARVRQTTTLEIEAGAEVLYWDLWTTGRSARGEEQVFRSLENRLKVLRDGHLLFQENWRWEPSGSVQAAGPTQGSSPALLGEARQWFLAVAQGESSRKHLEKALGWVSDRGGAVEMGILADDLWIARYLSPRSFDLSAQAIN